MHRIHARQRNGVPQAKFGYSEYRNQLGGFCYTRNSSGSSGNYGDEITQDTAMLPSTSSSVTPIPDEDSNPTPATCVRAPHPRTSTRAIRGRTTVPDFNRMLDIMSTMADLMSGNRSEGQYFARCLEGIMARVPLELKPMMWAGVIRYINTFILPFD